MATIDPASSRKRKVLVCFAVAGVFCAGFAAGVRTIAGYLVLQPTGDAMATLSGEAEREERPKELIYQSENFKEINDVWEKLWFQDSAADVEDADATPDKTAVGADRSDVKFAGVDSDDDTDDEIQLTGASREAKEGTVESEVGSNRSRRAADLHVPTTKEVPDREWAGWTRILMSPKALQLERNLGFGTED